MCFVQRLVIGTLVVLTFCNAEAQGWELVHLSDRYPRALCSDRSSAAYYYRAGRDHDDQSSTVILVQQGGFWCWDSESCERRWDYWSKPAHRAMWKGKHLMSSKYLDKKTLNGNPPAGMFEASSRNPFQNASIFYIPYCSSDAWTGSSRDDSASRFVYRGHDIVRAVLAEIRTQVGNTFRNLLVTGTSAGGLGTVLNTDLAAGMFPETRVLGIPDAGWFLDVNPAGPCQMSSPAMWDCTEESGKVIALRAQFEAGFTMWNAVTAMPLPCRSRTDAWRCLFAAEAAPHIKSRLYVLQSLTDSWQLQWNGGLPDTSRPPAIARELRTKTTAEMHRLSKALPVTGYGIFSPTCWMHGSAGSDSFFDVRLPDGASPASALSAAVFRNEWTAHISDERGWNVTRGCPAHPD